MISKEDTPLQQYDEGSPRARGTPCLPPRLILGGTGKHSSNKTLEMLDYGEELSSPRSTKRTVSALKITNSLQHYEVSSPSR